MITIIVPGQPPHGGTDQSRRLPGQIHEAPETGKRAALLGENQEGNTQLVRQIFLLHTPAHQIGALPVQKRLQLLFGSIVEHQRSLGHHGIGVLVVIPAAKLGADHDHVYPQIPESLGHGAHTGGAEEQGGPFPPQPLQVGPGHALGLCAAARDQVLDHGAVYLEKLAYLPQGYGCLLQPEK